ncbi:MAG: sulfur transferase domain-containing protein [Phycisphaerales bacterium]
MHQAHSRLTLVLTGACTLLAACAGQPAANTEQPAPPGTLAYDKQVFHTLLDDHAKIRRVVTLTAAGVEATTESDDQRVAGLIKDHALAMQTRMKSGSRVRAWDPVFADLFDNHQKATLEVTPIEKGVTIRETGADEATVSLLHSHALGVSEFVRLGQAAAPNETPRLAKPTPGRTIASIGTFQHQFDHGQPDEPGLAASRAAGATTVIDFRKASEKPDFDEKAAAERAGLAYINIPYQGDAELTDAVFETSRRTFTSLSGPALMHCRSGNRVGAAWLPYRVLDGGVTWEEALAEAKAIGLKDPKLEAKAKDYIARMRAK